MSEGLDKEKESLESSFPKLQTFSKSDNRYREIATRHDPAICCKLKAAGDVISSRNVKTIGLQGFAVVNFEVSSSSFRDYKNHL